MLSWDDILALVQDLPEIENGTSYGTPSLKVRGKFMARLRDEGTVLVVRCDLDEKPFLLEANPETLFTTAHYDGYGAVLVRLDAVPARRAARAADRRLAARGAEEARRRVRRLSVVVPMRRAGAPGTLRSSLAGR